MATTDNTVLPGQQTTDQRANAYRDAGVTDPLIAGSPVRRYTAPDGGVEAAPTGAYDSAAANYFGNTQKTAEDPAAIRSRMLSNVQSLVDSVKNTYAGLVSAETDRGVGRAGQTRAINARSGLVGSDFGAANAGKTEQFNADQIKALENERDNKISAIIAGVNERADAAIAADKNTVAKNSTDYLAFLKDQQGSARSDAVNLFKAGLPIEQLSDDEYRKLLSQTGYSPEQLKALSVINKPEDKVLTSFVQGNEYYVVSQDPITKQRTTEKVALGFTVPKDYTSAKLDDGSLVFYPSKGIDSTKPLEQQLLHYSPAGTTDKYIAETNKLNADAFKARQEGNAVTDTGSSPLAGYTKGQQKTLKDAGIKNAPAAAVFINTEPKFQDQFIRAVATSGQTLHDFTADEVKASYDQWVKDTAAAAEAKKKGNRGPLF